MTRQFIPRSRKICRGDNKAIALDPHFQEALDNKKAALEAIARQASDKNFEILLKNTPLSPVARKVAQQKIACLKRSQGRVMTEIEVTQENI